MFVLSVDSLCLSVLIMSHLRMTKTALCFYSRTLGHISISALRAPLSLSVAFVNHVWMSNDTFDIQRILPVVELRFNIVCQCMTGKISVEYICLCDERMPPYVM